MTARQGDHLPGIEFQQSESDHERENNRFGPAEKGDRYDDFKKDGKYGYINPKGEIVIDFIYDYASPFVTITAFNKDFQIALVCEGKTSYIILKNQRKVMSYRAESANDNRSEERRVGKECGS